MAVNTGLVRLRRLRYLEISGLPEIRSVQTVQELEWVMYEVKQYLFTTDLRGLLSKESNGSDCEMRTTCVCVCVCVQVC